MWKDFILNEQQKEYFKKLKTFVNHAYQTKTIYPPINDVYNAFKWTPMDQVKVVILGQDPYHGEHQAHGLCFSVQKGNKIPPSLKNIFKELYDDLGIKPPTHGDLTAWAKQGVLLLNTILTVEEHKPLSHKNKGWEIFTNEVIKKLNRDNHPKVFLLWGNNAKSKASMIDNKHHLVLTASHPSPLGARYSFFGSKPFSKTNTFLRQHNIQEIDWRIPN
jgi:uracil-DNA glycosylase